MWKSEECLLHALAYNTNFPFSFSRLCHGA